MAVGLSLMAASLAPPDPPQATLPLNFDLGAAGVPTELDIVDRPCPRTRSDEILVCGRRGESPYRLEPLAPPPLPFERGSPFELELGDVRVDPTLTQSVRPDGWVDYRIMLRLRLGF